MDLYYIDSNGKRVKVRPPGNCDSYKDFQSQKQLNVIGKEDAVMPEVNRRFIRLYGHYMCPFVEKVRLVLAAKGIQYQVVQINL